MIKLVLASVFACVALFAVPQDPVDEVPQTKCAEFGCTPAVELPGLGSCAHTYATFTIVTLGGTTYGECGCTNNECYLKKTGCNNNSKVIVSLRPDYQFLDIWVNGVNWGDSFSYAPFPVSGCGASAQVTITIKGSPILDCVFTVKVKCFDCSLSC